MHYTTLLTLALSAAVTTPVLAAPAPVLSSNSSFPDTNTTTDLRSRGIFDNGPQIGSFTDQFCTGKPVDNGGKLIYGGKYNCVKWTPSTDNMGINWGSVRALGVDFYSDDACNNAATKTYWAPIYSSDNGKGKTNICLSAKYVVGGPVRSVSFVPDSYYGKSQAQRAWKGAKDEDTYKGGKAPHG